jgi:precorrin-6A/cobalt-precorrin-6A reductase
VTVLLLAGTAEARAVDRLLSAQGIPTLASLAGATAQPAPLLSPTRIGGFGGAAGFRAVLEEARIGVVIDATHPFAARITDRTARLCAEAGVPYLRLSRPGWTEGPGDRWTRVAHLTDAPAHIPTDTTVFLATGRQSLPDLAALAPGRRLLLRQIDPPDAPFPYDGAFLLGRPPFDAAAEEALFRAEAVDWLVVKDAGGAGEGKLIAARALGLPVLMIDRPPAPAGITTVITAEAALDWLAGLP